MILKHFTKNNENHKNPFPARSLLQAATYLPKH